jgi:glycosyltransferase involved in cell wall biosynthesis
MSRRPIATRGNADPLATSRAIPRREPPRVALFDPYPHVFGGSQRVMLRQAQVLREHGSSVCVMLPGRGAFHDSLAHEGIPTCVGPAPPSLSIFGRQTTGTRALRAAGALPLYWLRLARTMRAWRPDIVHLNDHRGALLASVPGRLAGAKVVWHVHSLQPGTLLTTAARVTAHAVVVPSRAVVAQMPALGHGSKLRVLANPAPDLGPPRELPGRPRLVTASRIHPDKGLDVLLHALALLRANSVPDAELLVLGGTQTGWEDHPRELDELAERLGVRGAVTFAGHVDDVAAHLRSAAVYVQASRQRTEVMPLAILEAMAAGRPIVATAVGAVPEMIEDGATGMLVPPEDAGALASRLAAVLEDRTLALRLGNAAWKRSQVELGTESFGSTLGAIYEDLLVP